jgi:hypothetical protein
VRMRFGPQQDGGLVSRFWSTKRRTACLALTLSARKSRRSSAEFKLTHYWAEAAIFLSTLLAVRRRALYLDFATCAVPPHRASACGSGQAAQCQL